MGDIPDGQYLDESEKEVNFDSSKPAASITSNSIGKEFGPGSEEEGKFETNIVFQGGNNVMYEVDKLSKTYDEDETEEVALEIFEEAMDEMAQEVAVGKASYADLLAAAKKYWKEVGKESKDYYDSLEILRDAESTRLESESEKREDQLSYAQQYILQEDGWH